MRLNSIEISIGNLIKIVFFLLFSAIIFPGLHVQMLALENNPPPLHVVVFNGNGADPFCVMETLEALKIDKGIKPSAITAVELLSGNLNHVDVIVFPGGSGSKQYNNLGSSLIKKIRSFLLEDGKGVVGICAGAYLISTTPDYPCLNLVEANAIDREHDERGSALSEVSFSADGHKIFPEMKSLPFGYIQYHDGPVFIPSKNSAQPSFRELALFKSDIHLTGNAPAGMTPGKPFLLCQEVGKGRVFACAGHPESTIGMRWLVPRMARWAAKKELVVYSPEVVRPQLEKKEILHSDQVETELFWQLCVNNPAIQKSALEKLVALRFRNGSRWALGLLRDNNPDIRIAAAKALAETEYTVALPDLEAAVAVEKDPACKIELEKFLQHLKHFIGQ